MNRLKCPKKPAISHFNRLFSCFYLQDMLKDKVKKDLGKGSVSRMTNGIQSKGTL